MICANPKCGREFVLPSRSKRRTCGSHCAGQLRFLDPAYRRRISEISRQNWANPATREAMVSKQTAKKRTPEYRQMMRDVTTASWAKMGGNREAGLVKMRATKRTPESKSHQAQLNRERWSDGEYKARVSASIKVVFASPEFRKLFSDNFKRRWENPDFRQMMTDRMRIAQTTPQARANHSAAQKRLFADPSKAEVLRSAIEKAQKRFREIMADPQQKAAVVAQILESRRLTYARKKGQPLGIITADQIADATMALILDEFGHARAA